MWCAAFPGRTQAAPVADTTPPTIVAEATTAPNAKGWYRTNVRVKFTCAGTQSKIRVRAGGAFTYGPVTLAEGANTYSLIATDRAGNASERVITVNATTPEPEPQPPPTPDPPPPPPPGPVCTNVMQDGTFETGAFGFSAQQAGGVVTRTTENPIEGTVSLRVIPEGWGANIWFRDGSENDAPAVHVRQISEADTVTGSRPYCFPLLAEMLKTFRGGHNPSMIDRRTRDKSQSLLLADEAVPGARLQVTCFQSFGPAEPGAR